MFGYVESVNESQKGEGPRGSSLQPPHSRLTMVRNLSSESLSCDWAAFALLLLHSIMTLGYFCFSEFFFFNWSLVALQYCVNFCYTAK